MNSDLYRLVYCSRSEIRGTSDEVADALLSLLQFAQSENRRFNITGGLLSYAGIFAQVLEGPQNEVEQLFGRIQLDDRNSQVTVALRGPEAKRDFPDWSMAFADGDQAFADGKETSKLSLTRAAIDAVFANQKGAGESLFKVLQDSFLAIEGFDRGHCFPAAGRR